MEILLISGLSGSGKRTAAAILEDIGFYIVENLPARMMVEFAQFCIASQGKYDRVAFVYDVRSGETAEDYNAALEKLKALASPCRVLFLETDTPTIVHRYKETRRNHPLATGGRTIEQAMDLERLMMQHVRDSADMVIDTTTCRPAKLRSELLSVFDANAREPLQINVMSFGFKYGLPMEADLVFDVRFMPNPYYVEDLRKQTGLDDAVSGFVNGFAQTGEFLQKMQEMLVFLLPKYAQEGKTVLNIAFGCTGGRHRSVAVAHAIAQAVTDLGYAVNESHRDISR